MKTNQIINKLLTYGSRQTPASKTPAVKWRRNNITNVIYVRNRLAKVDANTNN